MKYVCSDTYPNESKELVHGMNMCCGKVLAMVENEKQNVGCGKKIRLRKIDEKYLDLFLSRMKYIALIVF